MDSHIVAIFWFWVATFLVGFIATPFYILLLKKLKLWKQIRQNALAGKATEFFKLHKNKVWTPTMWAWVILWAVFFMVLVSMVFQEMGYINNSLLSQKETYLSLFTLWTIWILWAIDDYMNIKWIGRTKWLSAKFKMLWLIVFAWIWAMWFYYKLWWDINDLFITPFWSFNIWIFFIPLFILMIVGFSNSVNITDWLDGLAWGLLLFSYSIYGYITFDQWLFLLSTLCFSIVGALMAFLWFNIKPAKFYMWDMWSLALWANLWIMAMLTNTVFVLLIVWAIFVLEILSVVIQLTSKKFRNGKKVFIIAPFHHHLEAIWWKEETVVFRLWLLWIIFAIFWAMFYVLQVTESSQSIV
jgi:phospho-N-acetylmuramoyl-pentapeptide-transferase